jgi:hypothetical protein
MLASALGPSDNNDTLDSAYRYKIAVRLCPLSYMPGVVSKHVVASLRDANRLRLERCSFMKTGLETQPWTLGTGW